MPALFEAVVSNVIVAAGIALFALALGRYWRNPALLHALWLVVLIKLVTPPLIPLACLPDWRAGSPTRDATVSGDEQASQRTGPTELAEVSERPLRMKPGALSDETSDSRLPHAQSAFEQTASSTTGPAIGSVQTPDVATGPPGLSFVSRWSLRDALNILFVVWAGGALFWFSQTALRIFKFKRTLNLASPAPTAFEIKTQDLSRRFGLVRSPRVMLLPGTIAPMVWVPGRQAFLLLPRELVRCIHPKKLDALITHEIGHLCCRHHWVRRFEILVTGLYWWCPLVWVARKQLRRYEEEICDAWVVNSMPGIAEAYASALLDTVEFLSGSRSSMPPVAVGISHFQFLKWRILMIMHSQARPRLSLAGWLVMLAVVLLAMPLSPTAADSLSGHQPVTLADTTSSVPEDPSFQDDEDGDEARDEEDEFEEFQEDEFLDELLEELTSGLAELNEEVTGAIEEARREISEGISDAPAEVLAALARVDVDEIVAGALRDAPRPVRMFVNEVDPARLIAQVLRDADLRGEGFSDEIADQVREEVTSRITEHIRELSSQMGDHIRQVRREVSSGIGEMSPSMREALAELNLGRVIAETTQDSHPIVKELVRELNIGGTIEQALQGRTDASNQRRSRIRAADAAEAAQESRSSARAAAARAAQADRRARDRADVVDSREAARQQRQARDRDQVSDARDDADRARAQLERRLERLLEEIDAIRRELRELDDRGRGR